MKSEVSKKRKNGGAIGGESEDIDINFEQALDMNSTVNNDIMDDDLDGGGPNNSQKQIQKVLEIKNEEFQRIGNAEIRALSAKFADL